MNNMIWELSPLQTFSITDILDILFISFIIYRVAIWIKTTKAVTLFRGIVMLVLVIGLVFIFNMTVTRFLIEAFFTVAFIAAVVVFQPELRKMLEEIGRGKLAPRLVGEEAEISEAFINEFVGVLNKLSSTKTGALVAIEQETPLADIEATGVKLDAYFTPNLLLNIFEPNAPLHDGAVVIKKNRIAAASCILPLTETEIGKDLGTRHRAAMGMSESHDALVFIVSEETGRISLAKDGRLHLGLKNEQIAKYLGGDMKYNNRRKLVLWKTTQSK